jgi:Protein of unknown function (DUF3237)
MYGKPFTVLSAEAKKRTPSTMCVVLILGLCLTGALTAPAAEPEEGRSDRVFKTEHMWDARVTIAPTIMLGASKHGHRRIVPITGGTFEGPSIRGEVVPGGEDWQLTRPDGDTELYARYLLKTHDGHLIQVINRVLWHYPPDAEKVGPYVRSVIDLEAPIGSPYEYLNHAIFLGTLTQPKLKAGEKPYVVIGVYKVL